MRPIARSLSLLTGMCTEKAPRATFNTGGFSAGLSGGWHAGIPSCGVIGKLMYLALDILMVLLGVAILWKRDRLARYAARWQKGHARTMPWAYPGWLGRVYTSERAWRMFIPLFGLAFLAFGLLWLWQGVY